GLAVFDTATWSRRLLPVGYVDWPSFSPDGRYVVFETRGDHGRSTVAVAEIASAAVKKLPQLGIGARVPRFSADGKRLIFEVRDRDPVFPRSRGISRIASVAFEP